MVEEEGRRERKTGKGGFEGRKGLPGGVNFFRLKKKKPNTFVGPPNKLPCVVRLPYVVL